MQWKLAGHLRIVFITVSLLSLLVGCGSKKISTSVADQTFVPGQKVEAPVPAPEEARVAEAPIAAPSPSTAKPREEPAPTAASPVIELADVYFDYDQASLRADARSTLEANAPILKSELKGMKILIEGHCDERGTLSYNLVLGEKRARAVKRYLEDLGIAPSQIQITSYGKERPFCTEHSVACWQNNRRAHFAVR